MKRTLVIEPYYGGSHKQFLKGLSNHITGNYCFFTLPARKWKMRMQLGAQWAVEQLEKLDQEDRYFDTVLCSTFMDVAVFNALCAKVAGWNPNTTVLLYFHENQFAYPAQVEDPSFFQFASINFNSALAADRIAFNSTFNRDSFFHGCEKIIRKVSDIRLVNTLDRLKGKAVVLYPGIDLDALDRCAKHHKAQRTTPVVVWNHRWEHDKNPDEFFSVLTRLQLKNVKFELILLGQSFTSLPPCFTGAKKTFCRELIHCGFVPSYDEYVGLLSRGTVVVSTSLHEFYGISVIEAVRAGCRPLLPQRLSYPELFDNKFLYKEGTLESELEKILNDNLLISQKESREMTEQFGWNALRKDYRSWMGVD
ncbi:tRNA-queuosine alpha-mannosyltransferase domain-containing protein [Desulforhopalus singaporensis]|uniref:tRNA-queuosine alpha-mannosyltransferase n=1 Tax=Desulforhopalus singaporensis TaxID=91360 RepID=A0A1H0QL34_9BACT|nr:DUF3524 domain-containing protein [Desulforhopalus singaporensis]SDP18027.1 Glycosyltransferase involved in cell wall bisynthesis [Desulforhopalus singaporensis]